MPNTHRKLWLKTRARRRPRRATESGKSLYRLMRSMAASIRKESHPPLSGSRSAVKLRPIAGTFTRRTSERKPEPLIDRAHRLDIMGQTDAALDVIYRSIDQLLRSGRFSE